MGASLNGATPKHPKMMISSRKANGCWGTSMLGNPHISVTLPGRSPLTTPRLQAFFSIDDLHGIDHLKILLREKTKKQNLCKGQQK